MNPGDMVRLDDQGRARVGRVIEPGKGAIEAGIGQHGSGSGAADAELFAHCAGPVPDQMAELGQHARFQPAKQRGAFGITFLDGFGIGGHGRLQFGPIRNGGMHVGHGRFDRLGQLAARLGIGARRFEIYHGFVERWLRVAGQDVLQHALVVAFHRHDRVHQRIDRDMCRSDRGGRRIDQKRHIGIDDGDA